MLGSGDVTHFQYDVAEVKLSVRERPEWLTKLTASGQHTAQAYVLPHTRTHTQIIAVAISQSKQLTCWYILSMMLYAD